MAVGTTHRDITGPQSYLDEPAAFRDTPENEELTSRPFLARLRAAWGRVRGPVAVVLLWIAINCAIIGILWFVYALIF